MANTFNFGAGNWATKEGSVLAYNSENGNFKPLPFDFTRASSATRVNENGLIEVVGSDEPRIDYLNNADGHLLLEPSRSNSIEYSDFSSGWSLLSGGSIAYDQSISPDGTQNAAILSGDGVNGNSIYDSISVSVQSYTLTVFAKQKDASIISLKGFSGGAAGTSKFNLSNGTIETASGGEFSDEKIEDYGNGWYRCSVKVTATSSGSKLFGFGGENSDSGELFSIYGAQLEAGSYATSYIPTSGSAVTRAADGNEQNPPSGIIGQTEGTIFLDADLYKKSDTEFYIAISDTTLGNSIYLHQSSQNLLVNKRISGATQTLQVTSANWSSGRNKCAIKYTTNEMKIFINGVLKDTESISGLPSGLSNLTVGSRQDQIGGLSSNSHYREVKLYNTALTDAELIALTS